VSLNEALARLASLEDAEAVNEAEANLARAAMRQDASAAAGRGREIRAEAFRSLKGWSGSVFLIEDRLAKSARGRFGWSSLALTLTEEQLHSRILGLGYEDAPRRWDDALLKLEHFRTSATGGALDRERYLSVKCRLLHRLDWFGLVGELLWLPESIGDWEIWRREDGWAIDGAAIEEWLTNYYHSGPFERSGFGRVGEYLDAARDACWNHFDEMIGDGDVGYMQSQGVRQTAEGDLSV
jgi:hypothetical protein